MDLSDLDANTEFVPLPAGHTLEVDVYTPQQTDADARTAQKVAVLCHPWSWLGGRKEDPVLVNLAVVLAVGLGINVFVPNSRAVGNSEGRSSFSGQAEAKDLQELVQWCVNKVKNVDCVLIVGYSHGSLLASCHPVLPAPIRTYHVLLSYPLSPLPLLTFFHASTYREKLRQLVQDARANVLIMYGDRDQFTAINKYSAWAAGFQSADGEAATGVTADVVVKMVPGADHFWRGPFNRHMKATIMDWLGDQERAHQLSS
ncbi:hypothetical protein FRC08_009121 [Ceratobasidium sp. 394]|nr:hypothetical protein FRC08_009121 [Ceratobasidium sp. 394]